MPATKKGKKKESLIKSLKQCLGVKRKLTLNESLRRLKRYREKRMWAELIGDALVSKNKKKLQKYYAEWKLSGKPGTMNDFLKAVVRAHEISTTETALLLRKAAKQSGRKTPRKRL